MAEAAGPCTGGRSVMVIPQLHRTDFPLVQVVLEIGSRDLQEADELADVFPHATVYSFECNPEAVARCRAAWPSLRNRDRIKPQYVAVHGTDGECDFFPVLSSRHPNIGASSLTRGVYLEMPELREQATEPIRVPCTRLDTWCRATGIERVDYVWSDLQGYDLPGVLTLGTFLQGVRGLHMETELVPLYEVNSMLPEVVTELGRQGLRPALFVAAPCLTFGNCDFIRA